MPLFAKPLSVSELRELSRDPAAAGAFSPLAGRRYLLVQADRKSLPASEAARIAAWLRQLPCPTLAIAEGLSPPIRKACDVVENAGENLEAHIKGIERSPLAAAMFVQVLRATEALPISEGLLAESLAYAALQAGPEFRRWLGNREPVAAPAADEGPAVVAIREGRELRLELNRPSNRNAMSVEMRDALVEALQLVLADASIRAVRISGRGRCFSVGGDLAEFGSVPDAVTGHLVRGLALPGRLLAQCGARAEAQVHSACIGSGIEFPAFARRVIAAPDAFFQLPELQFGLIPGAGGCVSIPRRIGRQRMAGWVLSGETIDARQALAWGLVDEIAGSSARTKRGRAAVSKLGYQKKAKR